MKKRLFFTLVTSLALFCVSCSDNDILPPDAQITDAVQSRSLSASSEHYYYYRGKKIPLNVHPTKRYVVVEQDASASLMALGVRAEQDSYYVNETQRGYIVDVDTAQTITTSTNVKSLNSLAKDDNIVAIEYVVGDSILTPISNEFYVKLKKLSDISLLEKYAKAIGCEVEGAIESDDYWISLHSNKESIFNSLEASNFIYETGRFAKVDPGFLVNYENCATSSDPYYSSQWDMNGTYGIKANNAWDITKGNSNITVAVVEGGIYTGHPDLANRISHSYDVITGGSPIYYDTHATGVAGIIAANHNNIGVAGVAPNVHLMNIFVGRNNSGERTSRTMAAGIKYAWENGADIINNSWGNNNGKPSDNSEVIEDAINDALTKGRNGKGCVVVFSSGNGGIMAYPAKCIDGIMAVGETNSNGNVTSTSGKGPELDVVAPGYYIPLLNQNGSVIFTEEYCTGTSFAAPHVSGIAALILSLNPNLTQSQVNTIIKETASSKSWNSTQGYGRVNAYAALKTVNKDYSIAIANGNGSVVNALAKFYIPNLPKSATVQWSTSSGKATFESPFSNDTVTFRYNFTGRTMSDEIRATVTYCGMTSNHSIPVTVTNEPKIFGVERIEYDLNNDRLDFKVVCSDNNATFTWSGGETSMCWIDFPYAGDASFIDAPQIYKSLDVTHFISGKTYTLSVTASNQYAWDTYYFEYTHPYSNGMLNENQEEEEEQL